MTYYPKEGLLSKYQILNPPINQTTTEELQKPGFGEFITETELNEAIAEIESTTLTTEQANKLNQILPYSIGPNGWYSNTWPNIPVIDGNGVTEIGTYLDFHAHQWEQYQTNLDHFIRLSVGNTGYDLYDSHALFINNGILSTERVRTGAIKIKDYGGK